MSKRRLRAHSNGCGLPLNLPSLGLAGLPQPAPRSPSRTPPLTTLPVPHLLRPGPSLTGQRPPPCDKPDHRPPACLPVRAGPSFRWGPDLSSACGETEENVPSVRRDPRPGWEARGGCASSHSEKVCVSGSASGQASCRRWTSVLCASPRCPPTLDAELHDNAFPSWHFL